MVHSRKINTAGGPVHVEIHAGNRHILSYRCVLMNADGSNQQTVLTGDTVDALPDDVILPFASSVLSGKFLALTGILAPVVVNDTNQNFLPDCDLRAAGANGECGALSNSAFGSPVVNTQYTSDLREGWGVREHNWQASVALQMTV